jgi:hypothetical protein
MKMKLLPMSCILINPSLNILPWILRRLGLLISLAQREGYLNRMLLGLLYIGR